MTPRATVTTLLLALASLAAPAPRAQTVFRDLDDRRADIEAAVAASQAGDLATARHALERVLARAPQFTPASLLLGSILHHANELDAAQRVYEAALVYAPDDRVLRERLHRVRREAEVHGSFFQSQGAHFTVLFEGSADEALARRVLDVLEAAYWRVGTALLTFPERIIPVVLLTEEQFRDVTRSPSWAAAAYDGRIRVPMRGALANPDELDRVLTHEFTHALVQSIAPRGVPTWLHEGLAVAFEPGGTAWVDATLADGSARLPLDRLASGFERLTGAQARLAYAESAAAVRAMIDAAGPLAVVALLQDLARGERFALAFEQRIQQPFAGFRAGLAASP